MTPGTLRIALSKVDFPSPTQVTDDTSIIALKSLVLEPLVTWQPGGLVSPGLFERWEHSEDGCTWRFLIRANATFHDGKPCTSSDVMSFINGILDSRDTFGMRWSYSRYLASSKISAEGERIVKVENLESFADVLDIFSEFWICRVTPGGLPILGTGQYRVVDLDKEKGRAELLLVDPKARQYPRRIVAIAEPDADERLKLLRQGDVDAALNLELIKGQLNYDSAYTWGKTNSTLSVIYYLNCQSGIFQSAEARLAANLAVDTFKLVEEVFGGFATPSSTIVSPLHLGFQEAQLEPFPYEPMRARELLKNVDKKSPIILRTPTYMPEHAERISRFVAASLEAVGLHVKVEVETDRPEFARQVGLRKEIGDLALFDSSPRSTYRVLDDKISSTSRAVWWQGYEDEEVERHFQTAKHSIRSQPRAEAYAKCLHRLRENPPWLYIAYPIMVYASRHEIQLEVSPTGALLFT